MPRNEQEVRDILNRDDVGEPILKRDVSGQVLFENISMNATGTTDTTGTVSPTNQDRVRAVKVSAAVTGATPTMAVTVNINGISIGTLSGTVSDSTSTVLDTPIGAPNTFTLTVAGVAGTINYTLQKGQHVEF